MTEQVLIASRLSDGLVVFLRRTAGGSLEWVATLKDAEIAESDECAAELLEAGEAAAAEKQVIIDPYLIDVEREGGGPFRPTKFREVIRCLGPTIRVDFGTQTEGREA